MPQGSQSILMFVGMIAIFYFLVLRPQKKKAQEAQKMKDGMKIGDTIVTIGGIRGQVSRITEDSFFIKTGQDGQEIEFLKQALSYIVKPVAGFDAGKAEEDERTNADRLAREEEEASFNRGLDDPDEDRGDSDL
ncbi:preprotein translocase subunit YajC [Kallipyga massiliensis]|uniref:preprotein translocase subunit YajC n=1 Tax=Kallipyga massiliensis TaxID=1472764 RepID=UPI0004AC85E5|nr:preprotein translocase subunit YajC [Kallipyga massiliensis]